MPDSARLAYARWLKLLRLHPHVLLTPTTEIDRMWHDHMTASDRYEADCRAMVGYVPEHDDRPTPAERDRGYAALRSLWRDTFGEELAGSPALCDKRPYA